MKPALPLFAKPQPIETTVPCEGCPTVGTTTSREKPIMPVGWEACGPSKLNRPLAIYCPDCARALRTPTRLASKG